MQNILYGVGNAILREFKDLTKVIGFSQLKNVTVNMTANDEKVYGGDNPYPLASFPKDKAITITAENATFSMNLLNVTQGAGKTTGVVEFDDVFVVAIPADGIVTLPRTSVKASSVIVEGMTKGTDVATLTAGQYFQDTVNEETVNFHVSDAGEEVTIVYVWNTAATAETLSVLKDSMSKPFRFVHRLPIYDENTQIVAEGQLIIYKAQAKNNFEFNMSSTTAFAPKVELEALDPKRADKKLWDFTIAPVA